MLIGAGVDFIVVDSTNIQTAGSAADALQLRPWEVLAEEWLALRRQGVATPKIAIWHNLQDPNGDLWQSYVHGAYSDPAYDELIFKDSQKKVHRRCCSACARAARVRDSPRSASLVGSCPFLGPCLCIAAVLRTWMAPFVPA